MAHQKERLTPISVNQQIRFVDLFSGCGGLSLGFELANGNTTFDEILAIDNDPAVIRCFNDNFRSGEDEPVGRVADVNWFNHPSEILLYYLLHFCGLKRDQDLSVALQDLGVPKFLADVLVIDSDFKTALATLTKSSTYLADWKLVNPEAVKLAITKSFTKRLGIDALPNVTLNRTPLLWEYEYNLLSDTTRSSAVAVSAATQALLSKNAHVIWDNEIEKLSDAAQRTGRGQHVVVNTRVQDLLRFLAGPSGQALRDIWTEWRGRRDAAKAEFCLSIDAELRELYDDDREVCLLIGGPPCKGFSRIARPVMQSLREQGASAWTSLDYGDERNALMGQYILFLRALRPRVFLFENVSNFVSALKTPNGELDPAQELAQGIDALSDHSLKYRVASQVVRAVEHAVPQERDRFIMIGISDEVPEASQAASDFFEGAKYDQRVPLAIALQGLGQPRQFNWNDTTSGDRPGTGTESPAYTLIDEAYPAAWQRYIRWIRTPHDTKSIRTVDAHIYRGLRQDDAALIELFGPGQRWMDYEIRSSSTLKELREVLSQIAALLQKQGDSLPFDYSDIVQLRNKLDSNLALRLLLEQTESSVGEQHLLLPHYMKNGTSHHGDWLERLSAIRPSKTIIAHIGKDTYSYMHPYESRAITMREAARIQSFPDFFSFKTTGIVEGYAMIGNAVPPLLANSFASRLAELNDRYRVFSVDEHRAVLPVFGPAQETDETSIVINWFGWHRPSAGCVKHAARGVVGM